jgi:hypothetical protein
MPRFYTPITRVRTQVSQNTYTWGDGLPWIGGIRRAGAPSSQQARAPGAQCSSCRVHLNGCLSQRRPGGGGGAAAFVPSSQSRLLPARPFAGCVAEQSTVWGGSRTKQVRGEERTSAMAAAPTVSAHLFIRHVFFALVIQNLVLCPCQR